MTTVLPEFVASQNGALSSAGENSTAATNSCCVPPPPVLRQSYSAPQSNQDLQHTQFSATLCNEQGTGDRRFNGESYLLPSVNYHNQPSNTSSGFCDVDTSSGHGGFFTTATTCSTFSVSSSRTNSLSNEGSFSCLSEVPTSGVAIPPQDRKVGKVILVPDVAAIENNNETNFLKTKPSKKKGPMDVFLNKISSLSINSNSSSNSMPKSQSSSSLHLQTTNASSQLALDEHPNKDSLQIPPSTNNATKSLASSPKLVAKSAPHNSVAGLTATSTQALIFEKRPMGLPQKDPKEEQKHLEQYLNLLEEQKKREVEQQKSLQKQYLKKCKFADDMSQLQLIWLNDVIPNWSQVKHSSRVREMCWMGIPPKVRTKVWPLVIGNFLNITTELFTNLSVKSSDLIELFTHADQPEGSKNARRQSEDIITLIKLDVSRTFVRYKVFQDDPFYRESLQKLLAIFVCYRHDISYIQGMNNIAGVLLLNMELEPAFRCFANLINRPMLMHFFTLDQERMSQYYQLFQHFFSENLSKLHNHFQCIGLTPKFYLMQWILSLFSNSLPLDISSRIWDVYLLDGDVFLFRAAIGVLKYFEQQLLTIADFTEVAQFFNKLPDDINPDKLFSLIKSVSLSRRKFKAFCDKVIDRA